MRGGILLGDLLPLYRKAPQLTDEQATEYLNKLCVRLVFCLYAEDAGLFGKRNMFHDYLEDYRPQHFSKALSDLNILTYLSSILRRCSEPF